MGWYIYGLLYMHYCTDLFRPQVTSWPYPPQKQRGVRAELSMHKNPNHTTHLVLSWAHTFPYTHDKKKTQKEAEHRQYETQSVCTRLALEGTHHSQDLVKGSESSGTCSRAPIGLVQVIRLDRRTVTQRLT